MLLDFAIYLLFFSSVTDCYLFCVRLLVFTFRLMLLACKLWPLSFVKISSSVYFFFFSTHVTMSCVK